jgi:hypothetical protein
MLLAIIGITTIFVWLVRWATRGYPFHGHNFHHFHQAIARVLAQRRRIGYALRSPPPSASREV